MVHCEYCGKEHDGSYGSGRFCSKQCARGFSTRAKRKNINEKVSNTLVNNFNVQHREDVAKSYLESFEGYNIDTLNPLRCSICGYAANSYAGLRHHIKIHDESFTPTQRRLNSYVKAYTPTVGYVELDITNRQLEEYKKTHLTCEICGRPFSHYQTVKGEKRKMSLCVDHDHQSNKFRGLLCVLCNRSLEWVLRYNKEVESYLSK